MSTQHWDDVVVGQGLLGAVTARLLAEAGRRVAIVERGRAVTEPPGAHLRNTPGPRAEPDSFFAYVDEYVDYYDPDAPAESLPGAFSTSIAGGAGILWTNNCPRAVAGVDRPDELSAGEWDRCYTIAERYLEVRCDQFDDSFRQRSVSDQLAPRLAGQHRKLERLPLSGRRLGPSEIHYVGPADVLADAVGVQRVVGAVTRVRHDNGKAVGVEIDGSLHTAATVTIAGGAIDTPALLWRSGIRPPALGRFVSYHPVLLAQVVLDDGLWDQGSGSDPLPRLGIPPTPRRPWFAMVLRDTYPFPAAGADVEIPQNRLIDLQVFSPVAPVPGNRLSFSDDGRVEFHVPLRDADEALTRAIEQDADEIVGAIGRFRAGCEPRWVNGSSAHLMGSCRFGMCDDGTSVTDTFGRVRGLENLFLATNGVIPTRLAVNPTLTAAALAVRTAEQIAAGSPEA